MSKTKKLLHILLWFHLLLIAISMGLGFYIFKMLPEKMYLQNMPYSPYDAAIVPGVPYDGKQLSALMRARILWACLLYQNGQVKNLIFSGSAVYTPYVEAEVMAAYARALGVKEEHIFTETRAEHSTENVYYSYQLARQQGFEKTVLTTDPVQTFFLLFFIRQRNLPVKALPIDYKKLKKFSPQIPQPDVSSAIRENFVALPERENWLQRFCGTLGLRMDN
ncbi:MAG: hypothetical protein KatS3mg031_0777 [Chitinophagales bacterium]|nr:MAG: hypothetical protein KatS3mg031_0777 [Chitinophagales bacterium]